METFANCGGRGVAVLLGLNLLVAAPMWAQGRAERPARPAIERTTLPGSVRLVPTNGGQTVYDSLQRVTWLADGNLAVKEAFGVAGIKPNGSMDYKTAVAWVAAMNAANHGTGYLSRNNWTLPTTPSIDTTCSSRNINSFGFGCKNSTLGSLYYTTLGLHEPNTAVPIPANTAGPFKSFQPYLYWSASPSPTHPNNVKGFNSFSFNTGFQGSNVSPNYLYVLPMIHGALPGTPGGTGKKLVVNPGGQTVYDPIANVTWLADANLAATQTFGVAGINKDGAMQHTTAVQWVAAMNGAGYLQQKHWDLPPTPPKDSTCSMQATFGFGCTGSAMGELFYGQLGKHQGESVVATPNINVGPFHNIQPYLYWSCMGDSSTSPCQGAGPTRGFEWSFSFGNGFEGTDVVGNNLYVMAYSPDRDVEPIKRVPLPPQPMLKGKKRAPPPSP